MHYSSIAACVLLATQSVYGSSLTIGTVQKKHPDQEVSRRSQAPKTANTPEFDQHGFWYAHGFDVGRSKDLEFLIDTGSSDILVGSGYYKEGKSVDNLHKGFNITYYSANKNGQGTQTVTGKLYKDVVEFGGLSYPKQEIGIFPQKKKGAQGGIIGFAGRNSSSFDGVPWFFNLCRAKLVDQCRFGLAFGTNNTGRQIIGTVDKSLFNGELTVAPRDSKPGEHWGVHGDVTINNHIVEKDALLLTDSGTSIIFGPIPSIRKLYKLLGFQSVFHPGNASNPAVYPSYLYGYFPCDKPPTVGFSIPSASDIATYADNSAISKTAKIFNLEPSVWAYKDHGNNNCSSVIQGTDQFSEGLKFGKNGWLVGQAFHQGHYLDHNVPGHSMGFADLKNPVNP